MATIYRAPIDAPEWQPRGNHEDYGTWVRRMQDAEREYVERLQAMARARGNGDDLIGEIVKYTVADGYAQYVVWNTKPLQLVHIETGDSYAIPPAHARGLRLADIRENIAWERKWRNLVAARA